MFYSSVHSQEKDTVTFGYDPNWRPFQFIDDDGNHNGIVEDLLKIIEEKSNFVFVHSKGLSWQKSLSEFKEGHIDLLPVIEYTKERSKWIQYTKFNINYPIVFVKRMEKQIFSIDSTSKYRVALSKDYGLSDLIREAYPNLIVIETNSFEESLFLVMAERVDITFELLPVAGYSIERRGFNTLEIGGELSNLQSELRMGVLKGRQELVDQLDTVLLNIPKADLAKLFDKWVTVKYEHGVNMKKVWKITFISLSIVLIIIAFILFWNRTLNKEIKMRKQAEKALLRSYEEISEQKDIIEQKNEELSASIRYAKGIQRAIIPDIADLKDSLGDLFMIYLPKDIVSGDFYWYLPTNEGVYFAVADCTGHGVPGSLLSIVCIDALNHSIQIDGMKTPAEVLDRTRELVVKTLENKEREVYDGMDIALCFLNDNQLQYAGAHNPLFLLREGELNVLRADARPVGMGDLSKSFTNHELELKPLDSIYIFTDGFADQFGGSNGKKLKIGAFKRKLLEINHLSISDQENELLYFFEQFKEGFEQVDDVTVMGLKINLPKA